MTLNKIFETILIQPFFNALIVLMVVIPGHSLGWAVIILTVLIRIILLPFGAQGIQQQHKMRALQPELQMLQDKHKDDKETQAKEIMALYKKYDIHPLGSCLPMLIQLPILIALYYVFRNGLDTHRFDLLYSFVPHPTSINTLFLGIDLAKPDKFFILPIIAGLLQFFQARRLLTDPKAHKTTDDTQKAMNAQLMYFMPLVTVFISVSLPAALALYWVTTTIVSILQQEWITSHVPPPQLVDVVVAPTNSADTTAPESVIQELRPSGSVKVTVRQKSKS